MLKKNLVKIFILTLKMCDLANKPVPTAASPSVANSWQDISASLVIYSVFVLKISAHLKLICWDFFCLINLDKIRSQNFLLLFLFNAF